MRCAACSSELLKETFAMRCADGRKRSFCRTCVKRLDAAPAGMARLVRYDMPPETRMRTIPESNAPAIMGPGGAPWCSIDL